MTGGDLYSRIAPEYDALFPVDDSTVLFLLEEAGGAGAMCLDVGCGTGSHVKALLDRGAEAYGTDASEAMMARSPLAGAADSEGNPRVRVADLFGSLYCFEAGFDLVYSIGNTISHLPTPEDAYDWAGAAQGILKPGVGTLKPGGSLVLQYVEAGDLEVGASKELPRLESPTLAVERTYRRVAEATAEFQARVITNSGATDGPASAEEPAPEREPESFTTTLCVIDTARLSRRLYDAGYDDVRVLGGFSHGAVGLDGSWVRVVTARRPSH